MGPGRLVLAAAILALAACQAPPSPSAPSPSPPAAASGGSPAVTSPAAPAAPTRRGTPGHIVVAVFENTSYRTVVESGQAPWLHELMGTGAVFTDSHGVAHPSQPNYLALFSGSTQGITDDHCPVRLTGRPNLARQLLDAGRTFAGYSEGLPAPGSRACANGRYAAKHNPWADFDTVPASANQPLASFPASFADLPTVSFVVPDLCHDMHDCSLATGDAWGRAHLDGYRQWARDHDSLLVVTFDEDDNSADNHILTVVDGAGVRAGQYPQRIDHFGLLRAIEDCYGLPPLGAAASAPILDAFCG
jgi:phosphatidylinositol-3-phosphatase